MLRFKVLLFILISYQLSGCAGPTMLFGGVTGTGATLSKEKTVGDSVDDYNIWNKIKASFLEHHKEVPGIMTSVSVEVSEGRVLLTGTVETAENRLTVLKLVWRQAGVREVINEIKLSDQDHDQGIKKYTSDTWITTQVKSKMLMNDDVRSINYSVETINSVVYILGVARSEEELNQIRNIVQNVKGVEKFVNYIRVAGQRKIKEKGNIQVSELKDEQEILSKGKVVDEDATHLQDKSHDAPKNKSKEVVSKPKEVPEDDIDIEYIDSDD